MTEVPQHGGSESREATSFLGKQAWLMGSCAPANHSETQVSSESFLGILEGTPSSSKLKLGHLGAGESMGDMLSTLQPLARGTAWEAGGVSGAMKEGRVAEGQQTGLGTCLDALA